MITPFTDLNVLQIVFMAAVAGIAALQLGEKAQPILNLSEAILELLQKALWWVIRLAPIGTIGLIGYAIADYGWDLIGKYATFTADVYIGCALVMFGVYPLLLATVAKVSPLQFFKGAWPAIQLGFVSRSSVGTMPVTQQVTERLGVPKEYASFSVPFGATTKMDGCAAIYPALAAIFIAQIFDVQLGVGDYILIAFVSVIGSAATAGLTGATVMLTLTLSTLGLPLEGVGLLMAIDPILDMMRTATNVAGQALVPVLVSAREKILDHDLYNSASASPVDEAEAEVQDSEPAEGARPRLIHVAPTAVPRTLAPGYGAQPFCERAVLLPRSSAAGAGGVRHGCCEGQADAARRARAADDGRRGADVRAARLPGRLHGRDRRAGRGVQAAGVPVSEFKGRAVHRVHPARGPGAARGRTGGGGTGAARRPATVVRAAGVLHAHRAEPGRLGGAVPAGAYARGAVRHRGERDARRDRCVRDGSDRGGGPRGPSRPGAPRPRRGGARAGAGGRRGVAGRSWANETPGVSAKEAASTLMNFSWAGLENLMNGRSWQPPSR